MNAIVSVTRDWGIGLKGALVVRNRDDMRFFRQTTMGGTVLCGRATFQSFPGGALSGRRNVVLTRDPNFVAEGAEVVHSVEEALAAVAADDPDRVWLIGGESVYRAMLGFCSQAYVTMNDIRCEVDARFPDLDQHADWQLERALGTGITSAGIPYEFRLYSHISPR